jgi:hypothetical protein
MISKIAGTNSNSSTRTKLWWGKLAVAILLSNILFFLLFSKNEKSAAPVKIPTGWVEIHVKAELLTPFQTGKKVLLLQRIARKRVEAMLETSPVEPEGRFTVLVRESEADALLKYDTWEIVPFLKTLSFAPTPKGENHEIRY